MIDRNKIAGNTITKTTCPYCGVGCGIEVEKINHKTFQVQGDQSHPANRGLLCTKGRLLGETLSSSSRITNPQIRQPAPNRQKEISKTVSWDKSINFVADQFLRVIKNHGPDAIAFYVSGQLLTEDYYVANK